MMVVEPPVTGRGDDKPRANMGAKRSDRPPLSKPEIKSNMPIAVRVLNGRVVVNFGEPIRWFSMTGKQARRLGRVLFERAREV